MVLGDTPSAPDKLDRFEGYLRMSADDVVELVKLHIINAFKKYGSKSNVLWNCPYLGGAVMEPHVTIIDRFLRDRELQALAEKNNIDVYDVIRDFVMMNLEDTDE